MVPDGQYHSLMRTQPGRDAFHIFSLQSIKFYEYETERLISALVLHRLLYMYMYLFLHFPNLHYTLEKNMIKTL